MALFSAYVELMTYTTGKYIQSSEVWADGWKVYFDIVQNVLLYVNLLTVVLFLIAFVVKPAYVKVVVRFLKSRWRKFRSNY